MTYVKNTWQKGDVISSTKLNAIEKGIEDANAIQGAKGDKGDKGDTGLTGTRGSMWYSGVAITGTSTTGTVFSSSGITSALVEDRYFNTSTGNVYKCTAEGNATVAKWVYETCLKGATGTQGATGSNGLQGVGIKTITGTMGGTDGKDLTLAITLTDNTTQNVTVALPIV